jgi:hypothetical protein
MDTQGDLGRGSASACRGHTHIIGIFGKWHLGDEDAFDWLGEQIFN